MDTVLTADRGTTLVDPFSAHRHTRCCWWDLYRAAWRCSAPATAVDQYSEPAAELPR